jgi:hypothetical protein
MKAICELKFQLPLRSRSERGEGRGEVRALGLEFQNPSPQPSPRLGGARGSDRMKTNFPFCRLVGMSALTPALSPRRGSGVCQSLILRQTVRPIQSLELSRKAGTILPLLGGEGRGEGGRRFWNFKTPHPTPLPVGRGEGGNTKMKTTKHFLKKSKRSVIFNPLGALTPWWLN